MYPQNNSELKNIHWQTRIGRYYLSYYANYNTPTISHHTQILHHPVLVLGQYVVYEPFNVWKPPYTITNTTPYNKNGATTYTVKGHHG